MSDDFDHRIVWSPSLIYRVPIIHDHAGFMRRRRPGKAHIKEETITRCGMQVVERLYEPGNGGWTTYGVFLFAGHADAVGAHWCKRCYRAAS